MIELEPCTSLRSFLRDNQIRLRVLRVNQDRRPFVRGGISGYLAQLYCIKSGELLSLRGYNRFGKTAVAHAVQGIGSSQEKAIAQLVHLISGRTLIVVNHREVYAPARLGSFIASGGYEEYERGQRVGGSDL